MSRKKKKNHPSQQRSGPVSSAPTSSPLPSPNEFSRQISFDSLEDKIRGEEMLQEQEQRKLKEAHDIKKKLESAEVDRRMEQLRQQLGLQKDTTSKKRK